MKEIITTVERLEELLPRDSTMNKLRDCIIKDITIEEYDIYEASFYNVSFDNVTIVNSTWGDVDIIFNQPHLKNGGMFNCKFEDCEITGTSIDCPNNVDVDIYLKRCTLSDNAISSFRGNVKVENCDLPEDNFNEEASMVTLI